MMEKFRLWFIKYNTEFTWWLIGWLSLAAINELIKGNWLSGAIDVGLAYFNYYMWKTRNL